MIKVPDYKEIVHEIDVLEHRVRILRAFAKTVRRQEKEFEQRCQIGDDTCRGTLEQLDA
jgi:hypothetical protein